MTTEDYNSIKNFVKKTKLDDNTDIFAITTDKDMFSQILMVGDITNIAKTILFMILEKKDQDLCYDMYQMIKNIAYSITESETAMAKDMLNMMQEIVKQHQQNINANTPN